MVEHYFNIFLMPEQIDSDTLVPRHVKDFLKLFSWVDMATFIKAS
jgi:hypothetical protein